VLTRYTSSPVRAEHLAYAQPIAGPDVDRSLIFQQPSLYP
jgi:hypothetical protein